MRRSGLTRRTPMSRGGGKLRAMRIRPRRNPEAEKAWQALREAIYARARQRCERCGTHFEHSPMEGAHRKARSQGGPDTPENVCALCRACHSWAHAHPVAARAEGYAVESWGDPALVPVVLHTGRRVLLTGDGGYVDAPDLGDAA